MTLESTLESLGFLINLSKSDRTPSQHFTHLGMTFLTDLNLVLLPEDRVQSILSQHRTLGVCRKRAPVYFIASWASPPQPDIIPLGRLRLRPLQWALKELWDQRSGEWDSPVSLSLSPSFKEALLPWLDRSWLEAGVPLSSPSPKISLCTDASISGWGAQLLPQGWETSGTWSRVQSLEHFNSLEMRPVLLACNHWRQTLRNEAVMVLSDNSAVVSYIQNQGGTHSFALNDLTRELFALSLSVPFSISVRHIPGRLNLVADSLSRRKPVCHTEWTLHQGVFRLLCNLWDTPHVDLFATRWNAQLPLYVSPVPDPQAMATDSLSLSWTGMFAYAFPPAPIIPKVLTKIRLETCRIILIFPLLWSKSWINDLLDMALCVPRALPLRSDLLRQPRSGLWHPNVDRLNLHACPLSGLPSSAEDTSALLAWKRSSPARGLPL